MSGPFDAKDSPDRLKGFRQAMDEAGLPVSPNMVFEGNYWMNRGARALDFFMEGRKTYPQAIICANDFMALSICDELKKRGLKQVPIPMRCPRRWRTAIIRNSIWSLPR